MRLQPISIIVALEISMASGLGGIQFPNGTIGLLARALQDSSWVSGLLTHKIHHETGGVHAGMSRPSAFKLLQSKAIKANSIHPRFESRADVRNMQSSLMDNTYQFQNAVNGRLR
jgi:hypothetical protein